MSVFKLKQFTSTSLNAAAGAIRWNYDRAELIADGIVHVLGLVFGIAAATALIVLSGVFASPSEIVSVSVYAAGLLAMLGLSAAYNLWAVSPRKWILRRFDHSAIYILIAATYTPVFSAMKDSMLATALLTGVWCVAIFGVIIKLCFPGRYDRLAVGLYLVLGWSGMLAYDTIIHSLPRTTLWFIAAGGILYTLGVVFHAWQRLRFQNAIWHGFVLLGAACHYTAVLDLVLST
ncbi:MAG: DNA-binding protein [Tardiphaga sp.]|nr:DNA-binding protein [Tardiphaga sp.]